MTAADHLTARRRHLAECQCEACSFGGCTADRACEACRIDELRTMRRSEALQLLLADYDRLRCGENEAMTAYRDALVKRLSR